MSAIPPTHAPPFVYARTQTHTCAHAARSRPHPPSHNAHTQARTCPQPPAHTHSHPPAPAGTGRRSTWPGRSGTCPARREGMEGRGMERGLRWKGGRRGGMEGGVWRAGYGGGCRSLRGPGRCGDRAAVGAQWGHSGRLAGATPAPAAPRHVALLFQYCSGRFDLSLRSVTGWPVWLPCAPRSTPFHPRGPPKARLCQEGPCPALPPAQRPQPARAPAPSWAAPAPPVRAAAAETATA